MFQPVLRVLSMLEQWSAEVLRQPGLMFTLIVAPFLLLLAFGEGVSIGGPRPSTVIVQPPEADDEVRELLERIEQYVHLVGTTESLPLARRSLERGEVDAVIVIPEDPQGTIEAGQQIPIRVLIGEIDPVRRSYARGYLRDQISALNREAVTEVITNAQLGLGDVTVLSSDARRYVELLNEARDDIDEARRHMSELRESLGALTQTVGAVRETTDSFVFGVPGLASIRQQVRALESDLVELEATVARFDDQLQASAGPGGMPTEQELAEIEQSLSLVDVVANDLSRIPPEVLTAPFVLEMEDISPVEASFTVYYSPGVLALLIQHLAITLGALTMSRMRLLRITDMLRVAPVRPSEVVIGSYVSYTILCALAAAGLFALLHFVLGVPVTGSYLLVVATIVLLILCSLGIGFVISLLSASVQQAVQVGMLLLLGSIFFSGFVYSLDQISWPVRAAAFIFPATYGIRTLQDVMLRGLLRHPEDLLVLGVATLVLFIVAVVLMRRELRPN